MSPEATGQPLLVHGTSPFAPLARPLYRALWITQLAASLALWMQGLAAVWLMGTLGGTALLVALVQSAQTFPMFVIGLPAGALADIFDRRRQLIVAQALMVTASAALGILSSLALVNPGLLLTFTLLLGMGNALNIPAWMALQPELVSKRELPQAIALGTASGNIGLALGPAIGGIIVAVSGPGAVFLLNAILFVPLLVSLVRWHREPNVSDFPAERLLAAVRAGLRYARHSPSLGSIFIRVAGVTVPVGAITALLPTVARHGLGLDSAGYGILLAFFGTGGVVSTVALPRLRSHLSIDGRIALATVIYIATVVALAFASTIGLPLLVLILFICGGAWQLTWATFQVAMQRSLPDWVRGRGMGLYFLAWAGAYAAGGALFGELADRLGPSTSLLMAAATLIASLALARWWSIADAESLDHGLVRDESPDVVEPMPSAGPVLIRVNYRVLPENQTAFLRSMRPIEAMRRRLGASGWGLYRDPGDSERFLETFVVESWIDYRRLRERVTIDDRRLEAAVDALLAAPSARVVEHYISPYS